LQNASLKKIDEGGWVGGQQISLISERIVGLFYFNLYVPIQRSTFGLHVTKVKNVKKDGQLPSMHMDLEKLGLKQLQAITPNYNMASSVEVQLHF